MNDATAADLHPYGSPVIGTLEQPFWPPDYVGAALARAQHKRSAPDDDAPIGRDPRLALNLSLALAFLFVSAGAMVAFNIFTGAPPTPSVWLLVYLLVIFRSYRSWIESDARTPAGAVRAWVASIQRRNWHRLDHLRMAADRDDFPRIIPGEGAGDAFPMTTTPDVQHYWEDLTARNRLARAQWTVSKLRVQPLAGGLSLVTFRLAVGRVAMQVGVLLLLLAVMALLSTFLAVSTVENSRTMVQTAPLILLVFLVAALLLIRRRRQFNLSKLVILHNGRWRIFSGDWQAPEDRNRTWLVPHA